MTVDPRIVAERFPRSSKYNPDWILASASSSANVLWLTEWLAEAVALRPGTRVLDLGSGRAASLIFMRREFGVEVWAADLWFSPSENLQRIRDAGVEDGVFPIHADARSLPFADSFFDAIVCIDAFSYFGTDDLFLNYLTRFVKPGGAMGLAGAGLTREIASTVPEHLRAWWTDDLWCLHAAPWWRRHWERTGIVELDVADTMVDGWKYWLEWPKQVAPDNTVEIEALAADQGRTLGYIRMVGRRRETAVLSDPIVSLPAQYTKRPLLRERS